MRRRAAPPPAAAASADRCGAAISKSLLAPMAFRCGDRGSFALRSAFSFVFQSRSTALAAMPYRSLSTQSISLLAHTVDRYGAVHVDTGKLPNSASLAPTIARDSSAASIEFASQLDASLLAWQAAGRKAAWIQLRTQTRHFVLLPLERQRLWCLATAHRNPTRILTTDHLDLYYATCISTTRRIPAARSALVPAAIARGFAFHHADPQTQVYLSFAGSATFIAE